MPGTESQDPAAPIAANGAALPVKPARRPDNLRQVSPLRQFVESFLCLALAVIVFRTFEVEGYVISTGSMAPTLLGFHKRVVCPTCKFPFNFGVAFQTDRRGEITGDGEDEPTALADFSGSPAEKTRQLCECPNCGQQAIDVLQVPRNQGDQLLVFREAYWFRPPRRWEVIVFRNPQEPTQAYVKRLVGLPGETVEIREGDTYADGTICRKDYATQRAIRIPVYDHDYEPTDDPTWRPRWRPDAFWKRDGQGFVVHSVPAGSAWSWITYRHFLRSGGGHVTSVNVPITENGLNWSRDLHPAQFHVKTRTLSCQGVMSADLRDRLRRLAEEPDYQRAIEDLYRQSHFAPVMDTYGYNRVPNPSGEVAVRDLMMSLQLTFNLPPDRLTEEAQFAVEMTDGAHHYRLVLDVAAREIRLLRDPEQDPGAPPLRTAAWRLEEEILPCQVELSLMDRQVTAALNGREVFAAWPMPESSLKTEPPRKPVRLGMRGLSGRVDSLRLFRDTYYTSRKDDKPWSLGEEELFVLGDNSPISLDSRRWKDPAVPLRLLLGKPFVVHLPSRQLKVRVGETIRHIRIPDFSRVRYIR